jgi:metallo-beta-lactamase class B
MKGKIAIPVVAFLLLSSVVNGQSKNILRIDDDIQLIHLQDSLFIHVSWHSLEGVGRFSSNGMIIIRDGKAVMIDTPMDNDKTERLIHYVKHNLSAEVSLLIIGHYHDDCLGGLEFMQQQGIESIASLRTVDKCRETGLPNPSTSFQDSLLIDFHGLSLECRFWGAGHSFDNITVWIQEKSILFGGCLVKSIDSKNLGNLSDASVEDWDETIRRIIKKLPETETVIPGHGSFGGPELLTHTISLVEFHRQH